MERVDPMLLSLHEGGEADRQTEEVCPEESGLESIGNRAPRCCQDRCGRQHWVSVRPDRDPEPVRRFGCFTADLRDMSRWLVEKGVRSVAMQSTGVYWTRV
jgi:hypothetical protein